jgi:aminopeptidase YwaD
MKNILKHLVLASSLFIFTHSYAQDSTRFYKTIDTLCSPFFYGRGYENDGHLKTAKYLLSVFKDADTVFTQEFPLTINHFTGEMELINGKIKLQPCKDYIPIAQSKSGQGKYKTIILDSIFFTDTTKLNTFLSKDISSKAIVYQEKYEAKITSDPSIKNKIYSETGVIIKLIKGATLKTFSPSAWMPPSFFVQDNLICPHKKIQFKLQQNIETIKTQNIIATIKGKDSTLKELIICAHYDHVGGFRECYIPGANDNASGLSMLIELYNYYLVHQPNRTIKFIAFGGEEVGLVGSKYYNIYTRKENIHFVLNLDLLGAGSEGITVVNATIFKDQFNILETINSTNNYVNSIKQRGEAANSDHYYFSKKGIPAFFIYSNGKVGGYHNISDTPNKLEKGYFYGLFSLLLEFSEKI